MQSWYKVKNPFRIALNFVVIFACRFIPSLKLKNFFYRWLGMKIGKDCSIGLMAMFDIFFPELIEIGDNSLLGYNVTVLAHEFLVDKLRVGKVRIGREVMIGANTTILPGIEVGDGAIISACSLVNKDIKPGAFVGGVPARELKSGE